ncbi:MAG TPA: efflux RND transporter periplasmic adaptor subunit [Verrucomicrobiota bacterium]|nr:efflux RND transporter periplasmic adaptor subunit [Verrucomicrobiota bacterium]HRT09547.1 efflux RND transporter periplasmic adaptor subunit [Candidatus Paceibacterota bacterium]HRT58690.1 efflux RND transporter periplasmic adaptor subunit [Candidatus Paceibacterota bacterium]
MIRNLAIALIILVLVGGALGGIKFLQIKTLIAAGKAYVPPPETVASAVVKAETWQKTLTAIATITAVQGVTLTPDIPGTVREIAFESGATVARGDLLVKLDTSTEEAQLKAVKAQLELARINLKRAEALWAEKTLPEAELDAARAAVAQFQANAEAIQATIEKKTIRAPFDGQLGLRQVQLGQYLEAGRPIVSLQSLAPVYAEFSLPQQELSKLATGMPVRLVSDAYPGRQFEGVLSAINPDLDPATRSVALQATFANPDRLLRPGMFARAEVLLSEHQEVLVIPATAVLSAPYGDSVYVIEPAPATNAAGGLVVRQQFIRTGASRGDYVAVLSGLKPGERVASAGVFKLRNGIAVVENNELKPPATQTPRPADS